MPSSVQAYSITVTNSVTGSSPANGFIDNQTIQSYYAATGLESTPSGFTYLLAQAKARGNVRYREMIQQIQLVANCYVPVNTINNGGATAKTEGTSFAFTLYAEHGDASLITADELNPGQFLTSTVCLARCIARALTADIFQVMEVYDTTSADSIGVLGATTSAPRYGSRINAASTFEIAAYQADLATAQTYAAVTML